MYQVVAADMATDDDLPLRARKRRRTRDAFIQEALRLFELKGYEETTIEDIATAAEISRATFYNYFNRKDAIIVAWAQGLSTELATVIAARATTSDSPSAMIGALAQQLRTIARQHPAAMGELLGELYTSDRQRARVARAAFDLAGIIAPIVVMGREQGDFRTDIDATEVGAFVADGLLVFLARALDAAQMEASTDDALALMLTGIGRHNGM